MGMGGFQPQRPRMQMGMGGYGNGMDGQGHMGGGGGGYGGGGFENNNSNNMGGSMGGGGGMGGGSMGGGGGGGAGTGTGGFVMGGSAACGVGGTTWIKMRGLPFSTSVDDIAQWYNEDTSLGISPVDPSRWAGFAFLVPVVYPSCSKDISWGWKQLLRKSRSTAKVLHKHRIYA